MSSQASEYLVNTGTISTVVPTVSNLSQNMPNYTLFEAWSGVNWADLMAAHGAFGTDFYDRSILRPKHHAYYRSGRPVIKIGPNGALDSHEIRPIHFPPCLGIV